MPLINTLKDGPINATGVMSATPDATHGICLKHNIILPLGSSAAVFSSLQISAQTNPYGSGTIPGTFVVVQGQKSYVKAAGVLVPVTGGASPERQTGVGTAGTYKVNA